MSIKKTTAKSGATKPAEIERLREEMHEAVHGIHAEFNEIHERISQHNEVSNKFEGQIAIVMGLLLGTTLAIYFNLEGR